MPGVIHTVRNERGHSIGGPIPHFPEFAGMGYSKTSKNLCVQRHAHPGIYEICLFIRGHVTLYARQRVYHLRGGDVFVAWPGEPHGALHDILQPCTHYNLAFILPSPGSSKAALGLPEPESRVLCEAMDKLSGNHLRGAERLEPFAKAIFNGLLSASHCLENDQTTGAALGITRARAAMQSLLAELVSLPAASEPRGVIPPGIARAREFLESCPAPWPSVADLAEIAGMSASHFCACFSERIGAPPLKFSHYMRLRRAKELLAEPRASVTAVALRLGYCSSQHLAACFKQYLGQTPRAASRGVPFTAETRCH